MIYKFGRLLQLSGLAIIPVALAGNAFDPRAVSLWSMLGISGAGIGIFTLGWLIQQSVRPR